MSAVRVLTRRRHRLNDVLAKPGTFLNFGHLGLIERLRPSLVQLYLAKIVSALTSA